MFWVDPNSSLENQRKGCVKFLEEFAALQKQPAWEQLTAYWKQEEERMFQHMFASTTADLTLKAASAYATAKTMRELVESQLRNALATLQRIDAQMRETK